MAQKSNNIIARLVTDPSFREWCLERTSSTDNRYWEQWIAKHEGDIQDVITAKNIVLELHNLENDIPTYRKYESWEKLNKQIASAQQSKVKLFSGTASYSQLGWIMTAAASLVLVITTFLAIEYTDLLPHPGSDVEHQKAPAILTSSTEFGQQKVITLDSGTRITLNANSLVTYHDGWIFKDTVQVALEGEAFFDVVPRAADEGPVFQVKTSDGNIHVLGTRFVVSTWDQKTKVVLEEGEVAIERKGESRSVKKTLLQPDELAEFSRSHSDIRIKNVNANIYTSWTKGLFVFERAPLPVVADRIEKIFGKEVQIADQALITEHVSGAVENDNLEVLLSALSQTLQISVEQDQDTIIFRDDVVNGLLKSNTN
jgi:ferric-dicitrate binding protein FerR (iron transport regulator)